MFFYDSDIVFEEPIEYYNDETHCYRNHFERSSYPILENEINNYKTIIIPKNTDELIKNISTRNILNQPNLSVSFEQLLKNRDEENKQFRNKEVSSIIIDELNEEYENTQQLIACSVSFNEWYNVIKFVNVNTYIALMKVCKLVRGICTDLDMLNYKKTQWSKKELCVFYNNCLLSNDIKLNEIYYNKELVDWNEVTTRATNKYGRSNDFFPSNDNFIDSTREPDMRNMTKDEYFKNIHLSKIKKYERDIEKCLVKSNVLLKIVLDDDIDKFKEILKHDVVSAYIPFKTIKLHQNLIGIKIVNLINKYIENIEDMEKTNQLSYSIFDDNSNIHIALLCRLLKKNKIMSYINEILEYVGIKNVVVYDDLLHGTNWGDKIAVIIETHKIKI